MKKYHRGLKASYRANFRVFNIDKILNLINYKAFTLAEVLITIGIIGIVSVLTITTLISSYRKKVTKTKLQKAYSILNNTYYNINSDVGDPSAWNGFVSYYNTQPSSGKNLRNYFKEYLPGTSGRYSRFGYGGNIEIKYLNGQSMTYYYVYPDFMTKDGMVFLFIAARAWIYDATLKKNVTGGYNVLVDINGEMNGPNTIGKDIFAFRVAQGGFIPEGIPMSYQSTAGTCNSTSTGIGCTYKVLSEK